MTSASPCVCVTQAPDDWLIAAVDPHAASRAQRESLLQRDRWEDCACIRPGSRSRPSTRSWHRSVGSSSHSSHAAVRPFESRQQTLSGGESQDSFGATKAGNPTGKHVWYANSSTKAARESGRSVSTVQLIYDSPYLRVAMRSANVECTLSPIKRSTLTAVTLSLHWAIDVRLRFDLTLPMDPEFSFDLTRSGLGASTPACLIHGVQIPVASGMGSGRTARERVQPSLVPPR